MGKSSTTNTKSTPWEAAQPYLLGGAQQLQGVYNQVAPKVQQNADALQGLLPGAMDRYQKGEPVLNAATGYGQDVLGGKYLGSNPYFEQQIQNSDQDVRNQVAAAMGKNGLAGGSDYARMIANMVGRNDLSMRSQQYNTERGYQQQSMNAAPGLVAGQNALLDPVTQLYTSAGYPLSVAQSYANSLGGLLQGYPSGSSTQAPGMGSQIGSALGNIGGLATGLGALGVFGSGAAAAAPVASSLGGGLAALAAL